MSAKTEMMTNIPTRPASIKTKCDKCGGWLSGAYLLHAKGKQCKCSPMTDKPKESAEEILDDHFELIGAEPLKDYQKTFVLDVMQDYGTEYAQSLLSAKLKEAMAGVLDDIKSGYDISMIKSKIENDNYNYDASEPPIK